MCDIDFEEIDSKGNITRCSALDTKKFLKPELWHKGDHKFTYKRGREEIELSEKDFCIDQEDFDFCKIHEIVNCFGVSRGYMFIVGIEDERVLD
jgi:hypothetical protein